MRQLEERFDVRLLHRTTRRMSATDAGRRLLEQFRPATDQVAGALDDLDEERLRPMGLLGIYASSHLVTTLLYRCGSVFCQPGRKSSSNST